MEGMLLEKRTYKRDDLMQMVHYAPSPHTSDAVLSGLIKDYSNSGLCLIAQQSLKKGQEIIVNSIIMPYSKTATVRWQQNIGNATYKVGLEFKREDPSADPSVLRSVMGSGKPFPMIDVRGYTVSP